MTREEWLLALVGELRPLFTQAGFPLPEKIRVTCGLPSSKARSLNKAIGEHWAPAASADGHNEIFISPVVAEPMEVASVLSGHELDDVIPALGMLLAHACQTGNIPKEVIVKFIDNVLDIKCELHTRH